MNYVADLLFKALAIVLFVGSVVFGIASIGAIIEHSAVAVVFYGFITLAAGAGCRWFWNASDDPDMYFNKDRAAKPKPLSRAQILQREEEARRQAELSRIRGEEAKVKALEDMERRRLAEIAEKAEREQQLVLRKQQAKEQERLEAEETQQKMANFIASAEEAFNSGDMQGKAKVKISGVIHGLKVEITREFSGEDEEKQRQKYEEEQVEAEKKRVTENLRKNKW